MKKLKNKKGITLIALVITIIVMLILVAVTVSMAINGGLFEKAGKGVGDTGNEINKEQELANGRIKIDGIWYDSIDDYLNNNPSANQGAGGSGETGGTEGEEPGTDEPAVEGIAAADLPSTEYGKTVNYGATYEDASTYGQGKWEIFYADGNHIYLITRGHLADAALSTTGYTGTADFTEANLTNKFPAVKQGLLNKTYDPTSVGNELKYSSNYNNMKATEYLLDSTNSKWSNLALHDYADWAIGGPTFELFVKSYNAYYTEKTDIALATPSGTGYDNPLSASGSVPQGTYLNHYTSAYPTPEHYWLACPSGNFDVRNVFSIDSRVHSHSQVNAFAFRPVVCLQSEVSIKWNSATNQYDLVK